MAIISNIIRIIGKPIILKLGKGLKSTKKIWCPGEEMDISLDDSVVGKDNVTGPISSRINSLARWKDAIGKTLTDSKTIQDDDGTTETTSTVDGELKNLIDNLSSSDSAAVVQHLRSLVKTMIRQEIKDKQIWDAYIDSTSKSYIIRGQNLEDPSETGIFFELDRKGNITRPGQISCFGIMEKKLGNQRPNSEYVMGTQQAFTIIDNEGGYFYQGDGNGKPATFTFTVKAKFLVYMSMLVYRASDPQMELVGKVNINRSGTIVSSGSVFNIPISFGKQSVMVTTGVKSNIGDILTWSIYGRSSTWYIDFYDFQGQQAKYTNYIGVYCLG